MRSPKRRREVLAALSLGVTGAGCLEREPQDGSNATDGRPAGTDADGTGTGDGSTGTNDGSTTSDADSTTTDEGSTGEDDGSSDSTADRTEADGPVRVVAGPDGDFVFEPESLQVSPGTTVVWEWDSDNHNVAPESTPDGVDWAGHPEVADRSNTYEHTFEEPGTYEYVCEPHAAAGMSGEVLVGTARQRFDGTITVGPDGEFAFDPERVEVEPGTTVTWEWESDNHNVAPTAVPEGADWEGHPEVENRGTTYQHTFDVEGTYEYTCEPHAAAGMEGTIVVGDPDANSTVHARVSVGPGGEPTFDPDVVSIDPGETVRWAWDSAEHTITPESVPDGAEWTGRPEAPQAGETYSHTFEVEGTYEYACDTHASEEMRGEVHVGDRWANGSFDGTVVVGADDEEFDPVWPEIDSGTTVRFEWRSDGHDLTVLQTPDGASWDGVPEPRDAGHVHEHTFDVPGTYHYTCETHHGDTIWATIAVRDS